MDPGVARHNAIVGWMIAMAAIGFGFMSFGFIEEEEE
jgi:hypothetical protein